jgi:hypothetical protein
MLRGFAGKGRTGNSTLYNYIAGPTLVLRLLKSLPCHPQILCIRLLQVAGTPQ